MNFSVLLCILLLAALCLLSQLTLSLGAEKKRKASSRDSSSSGGKSSSSKGGSQKKSKSKKSSSSRVARGELELEDTHNSCEFWSKLTPSECEKNPKYMLVNCAKSCAALGFRADEVIEEARGQPAGGPSSFYEVVETDLYGNEMRFEIFRGKVVYIVNVASQCGYTEEGYELLRSLQAYEEAGLELVIAPCNQFGAQEPGNAPAIASFARKNGFVGRILSKADVNGDKTRPLYQYLKAQTGRNNIDWNFDGKFLVTRDGTVEALSGDSRAVVEAILAALGVDEANQSAAESSL